MKTQHCVTAFKQGLSSLTSLATNSWNPVAPYVVVLVRHYRSNVSYKEKWYVQGVSDGLVWRLNKGFSNWKISSSKIVQPLPEVYILFLHNLNLTWEPI